MIAETAAASPAAIAGVTFAAMYAAHMVADHWVQTDHQAAHKGQPGLIGHWNNLKHVAGYTAIGLGTVVAVAFALGHLDQINLGSLAAATGINFVTHYWADRRHTLAWLARITAHGTFYKLGTPRPGRDDNPSLGTGGYALDQSYHIAFLLVASVVTAIGSA